MSDKPEFQMQFWHDKTRIYVSQAEPMVGRYRAWRKVLVSKNWPLKNPKYRKAPSQGYSRTILEVRAQYLQWARERGLAVCDWEHNRYQALANNADRFVHKDKYFDVEHTEDPS